MLAHPLRPVLAGLAGGLASGLLGVGGGVIMVPLLVLWIGLDQRSAHAFSLAAIVPVALVGSLFFIEDGNVDLTLAAILAVGGVMGSLIGVRMLERIPERSLRFTFAAFCLLAGLRMVWV